MPQHSLEHLQLMLAIDRELGLAERIGSRRRLADRHRRRQHAPLGFHHPGPGDEVARPQVVAVEGREQHEQAEPDAGGESHRTELGTQSRQQEQCGHEDFDVAQQVACDHRLGGQAPPAARRDADAERALPRGRAARTELEIEEVAVASQEQDQDQHHRHELDRGLGARPVGFEHPDAERQQRQQQEDERGDDQREVEQQGAAPGAEAGDRERQREPFGGHELATIARQGRAGTHGRAACALSRLRPISANQASQNASIVPPIAPRASGSVTSCRA